MMHCEFVLAALLLAPAQDTKSERVTSGISETSGSVSFTGDKRTDGSSLEETIEVMRALLVRKLGPDSAGPQPNAMNFESYLYGRAENSDATLVGNVVGSSSVAANPFGNGTSGNRAVVAMHGPPVEGVYVDGHGVIFTVMLPAIGQDPRPGAAGPKDAPALTDWEREQRRLRGEPLTEKTSVPRSSTVGDIVLKLLAENGKHFAGLRDDERVTIALTFRGQLPHTPLVTTNQESNGFPGRRNPGLRPGAPMPPEPQTAHDQELLGDLHLKNGQPQSAVDAYKKALEMAKKEFVSEGQTDQAKRQLRDALSKLAQGHLAAGNMDDAQTILKEAEHLGANYVPASPSARPAGVTRPARLTISAPKKLLDQVGNGQITFDEFRKQATVDYVPPVKATGG